MRACPICGKEGRPVNWPHRAYGRCPACQFVYADQIPDVQALEQTYSAGYFSGNTAYRNYESDKAGLQKNFQHRIDTLRQFKPEGDLFEVGCAFGFFLECARTFWRVRGSDISQVAVQYGRDVLKLDVQQSDFEHFALAPESVDVIALWDVIEHLADPVAAIAKCRDALRPGGVIAFTTGDVGALAARLQGSAWRMVIPEHLYYFSKPAVTALLNRYGLEIVHFSHPGNYRSLSQLGHILTWQRAETGWRGRLLRGLEQSSIAHWGLYLNLYDIMYVIARKP